MFELLVDSETGVIHSVTTTAANAHDVTEAHRLLHGGATPDIGGATNGRRTVDWTWTGRWRCGLGSVGSWALGVSRHW